MVKYRNKFEETAGVLLKDLCKYESERIPYVIHKNYIPDFVGRNNKYKAIRDSLPKKTQLVFLLYNPNKKLRKGSRITMAEWCEKENIKWYTLEDIRNAFTS